MITEKQIQEKIKEAQNLGFHRIQDIANYIGITKNSLKFFYPNSQKNKKSREQLNKLEALNYKGGMCCVRCGYNVQIPDCYAFHHREPTEKEYSWRELRYKKWEVITQEIDKCDLLCHNCHSIVHYEQRKKLRYIS